VRARAGCMHACMHTRAGCMHAWMHTRAGCMHACITTYIRACMCVTHPPPLLPLQTPSCKVYDPPASLSADRRGVLTLPDPESGYRDPRAYNARVGQRARAPRASAVLLRVCLGNDCGMQGCDTCRLTRLFLLCADKAGAEPVLSTPTDVPLP
jgi:hypothetical protein